LVTGAAGGMGAAISRSLLQSGHRVILADLNVDAVQEPAAELGETALALPLDTTSKAGVRAFTDVLRGELAETGIRVTEILPGLTRTGIIRTRYRGDTAKEKEYFDTFKMALEPDDVARCISFALAQPRSVQIAQLVVLPVNRW
jgi:NADP-dependent 3-hydroxy acid dehydrogenase YdfG